MKKTFTLLLLLTNICLYAQTTYYQKSFGDVLIDDAQSMTATSDGGYCMVGSSGPNQIDSADITIYRLNQNGDLLWSRKIGDPKDEFATDIKQTSDGGFIIVGNSYASPLDTLYSDIFAMKVDDQGFIVWAQVYGGLDQDEAQSVVITSDGSYMIFGSTMSTGSSFKSALCLKIDANGVQQFTNLYSHTNADYFYRGRNTSDGNLIVVGGAYNIAGGTNFDHFIIKMDENGTVIWAKRYGTAGPDWSYDVTEGSDGYYIAGVSTTNTAGDADENIFKIDFSGNLLWTNNYGTLNYDRPSTLIADSDGNIIVNGYSNVGTSTSVINQMTLHKIDSLGNTIWSNSYGDPIGTSEGLYLIHGTDGGYIMCGYTIAFADPNGDAYVVKTDPDGVSGCFQAPINFTKNTSAFSDSSGANVVATALDEFPLLPPSDYYVNQFGQNCFFDQITETANGLNFSVYPNPASTAFTISCEENKNVMITISDLTGRELLKKITTSQITSMDAQLLSSGIYTITVNNGTSQRTQRLIIR